MTTHGEVAAVDKPMVYFDRDVERYVYRASALCRANEGTT